jgi:uncharacterized iron-regulated membrane protein
MFVVVFVGTRGLVSIVACVSGLFMFVVVFVGTRGLVTIVACVSGLFILVFSIYRLFI